MFPSFFETLYGKTNLQIIEKYVLFDTIKTFSPYDCIQRKYLTKHHIHYPSVTLHHLANIDCRVKKDAIAGQGKTILVISNETIG